MVPPLNVILFHFVKSLELLEIKHPPSTHPVWDQWLSLKSSIIATWPLLACINHQVLYRKLSQHTRVNWHFSLVLYLRSKYRFDGDWYCYLFDSLLRRRGSSCKGYDAVNDGLSLVPLPIELAPTLWSYALEVLGLGKGSLFPIGTIFSYYFPIPNSTLFGFLWFMMPDKYTE